MDWWIAFLPHCRTLSLTQTEIPISFSKKLEKLIFTKTIIFNKMFLFTRWNKKWQTSRKIVNREPRVSFILSGKDRKLLVFLKDIFFPEVALMDTFNQFLTKWPVVRRQKAKIFLFNVRKGWKRWFPKSFLFFKLFLWTLRMQFWRFRQSFRDKLPNSFCSRSENDQKGFFKTELLKKTILWTSRKQFWQIHRKFFGRRRIIYCSLFENDKYKKDFPKNDPFALFPNEI